MIEVYSPALALDLLTIDPQEEQQNARLNAAQANSLLSCGSTWTVKRRNGPILAVGGLVPQWEGRAVLWSILSRHCGPHDMLRLTRIVRRGLDEQHAAGFSRLESYVRVGHIAGERWAFMLGLRTEGRMRKFQHGQDFWMFSRVR